MPYSTFDEDLATLEIRDVSSVPQKRFPGRCRGAYSGLSSKIRALQTGSGFEFPAPDKLKERSLRSLVSSISRSTGCEYSVRLSFDRETIGVYRIQ